MTKPKNLQIIFDALGDNTRFKLVEKMIVNSDLCVSELAKDLKITPAGASQQLKILVKAGILSRVRKGQRICYELNNEDKDVKKIVSLIGTERN